MKPWSLTILLLLLVTTGCGRSETPTKSDTSNPPEVVQTPAEQQPTLPEATPLEDLPEIYGAEEGAADGAVVFTMDGVENDAALVDFLNAVSRDVPCRVRTVQDYGEGTPMVMDVIWENGAFLWRMRNNGDVYQQSFSHLVTDGVSVCLSNAADWDTAQQHAGKELIYFFPEGTDGMEEVVSAAKLLME